MLLMKLSRFYYELNITLTFCYHELSQIYQGFLLVFLISTYIIKSLEVCIWSEELGCASNAIEVYIFILVWSCVLLMRNGGGEFLYILLINLYVFSLKIIKIICLYVYIWG